MATKGYNNIRVKGSYYSDHCFTVWQTQRTRDRIELVEYARNWRKKKSKEEL